MMRSEKQPKGDEKRPIENHVYWRRARGGEHNIISEMSE